MDKIVVIIFGTLIFQFDLLGQTQVLKDSTIINAIVLEDAYIGEIDKYCSTGYTLKIKADRKVQVINAKRCDFSHSKRFYEIALDSNTYLIECKKLDIDTTYFEMLENASNEQIEKIRNIGIYYSALLYREKLLDALNFVNKASTKGIVVYDWGIYDESEYTDGTGFKITLLNPAKQSIKYAWITVCGYNAVEDKVTDPIPRQSTKTVKCIGPIDYDETGSYDFEYFWHTDIVQTAKITQIKIQYMNGTFKVISNPMSLVLDNDYRELFENLKKE